MKTFINILLVNFIVIAFSSFQAIATKQKENQNQERISIDLEALGAVPLYNAKSQPTMSELMRDCSGSQKSDIVDSIAAQTLRSDALQIRKEKEKEAYITEVRNQNRRFAGIISILVLIFLIIVGFTSAIFRRDATKSISEKSPFSLSRSMLFIWTYGILCSASIIWAITGDLPQWVVSVPLFLGIIGITFVLSVILERLCYSNSMDAKFMNENQFNMAENNSFRPFLIVPKLQYLVISTMHLGLLCAPAWIYFSFQDLSIEIFVIQLISSMIYLGHKAFKLQRVHAILFRKLSSSEHEPIQATSKSLHVQ
jgi:hypothetical protein